MQLDIRIPIGLLFGIIGAMLAIFGLITSGNEMYSLHSLNWNINLWWGLVMLAFATLMLWLAWRAYQKTHQ